MDSSTAIWKVVCGGFALLMTIPGLAFYYGGLVRRKNALSMMMQSFFLLGLLTLCWAGWGYSLAMTDGNVFSGGLSQIFFSHLTTLDGALGDVNRIADAFFYGTVCAFAGPLICGAIAERMKFTALTIFMVLWMTVVFCPVFHWVWVGGLLDRHNPAAWFGGALDYAGGLIVHLSAGVSALVATIIVGKRLGYSMDDMRPHNLTYALLGASLLWIGALFMHGGHESNVNGLRAVIHTHLSVAAGAVTWAMIEWFVRGRASALGTASGAIAGIVSASAACGFVGPFSSVVIAVVASIGCYFACAGLAKIRAFDDSLDVFGLHAVPAAVSLLLTAFLAVDGQSGFVLGSRITQFGAQLLAILVVTGWSALMTTLVLKLVDWMIGLRVTQESEMRGLDVAQHGQEGYILNK